jgi:tetratricopeptide (TPR) repeat protein
MGPCRATYNLLQLIAESPKKDYQMGTPDQPEQLYELGRSSEARGDFQDAASLYLAALEQSGGSEAYRHELVIRTIFSLKMAQRHEEGIRVADLEMDNWTDSPDYYFALGDILLDLATLNPETAKDELIPMVEASWLRCLEIGERPDLPGAVAGRGSYLAAHNLAVMYENLGDAERASQYRALADARR